MMVELDGFEIGVIFCLGLGLGILLITSFIRVDNFDVDLFGETLCAEHGLLYDNYETNEASGLKFYCKNETKLEDGYLVIR